jgi:hypothetical protein
MIGLGFTFFTGATEAWLVDALDATGYAKGTERVFGRGQSVTGAAMLIGSVSGGFLGQINLGVPYLFRSGTLVLVIAAGVLLMRDIGFRPERRGSVIAEVRRVFAASVVHGWRNRPVRLFMLSAPFGAGVGIWIFYAFQPYLLELLDDPGAVYVSGIAAAVFALAQIAGGASVGAVSRLVSTRTGVIGLEVMVGAVGLVGVGLASYLVVPWGFWVAIVTLTLVALLGVLSFNSLMGSAGGVVSQPLLGRVADIWSLGIGYVVAGIIYAIALPFILAVRRLGLAADRAGTRPDVAHLG